jgi:hypothetical protein
VQQNDGHEEEYKVHISKMLASAWGAWLLIVAV